MLPEKKMIRKRIAEIVLLTVSIGFVLPAQVRASMLNKPAKADLLIRELVFPADNDKAVRIRVVNGGNIPSTLCVVRLTVRKINGVPVGRVIEVKLAPLAAGKDRWVLINAKGILPTNVSLESTTFKLNADATSIVTESDEANNEVWHNL